jgi:hypothetical protein
MATQNEELAAVLFNSMGGSWYISKGRALRHADRIVAAGFSRPRFLGSEAEVAALAEGAVVERTAPEAPPEFYVKREGAWHSIDGTPPLANATLGGAGVWLALRRG